MTASESEGANPTPAAEPLSKRAQKRLLRAQQREITKPEWKARQKQNKIIAKARRKEAIANGTMEPPKKRVKGIPNEFSKSHIIIDLQFQDLMLEKLLRCHNINKNAQSPIPVLLTSFGGRVKDDFDNSAPEYTRYQDMTFESKPFDLIVPLEKTVYLTADAEDYIEELEDDTYYVIGGLVDKNRHKTLTYDKAKELGIRTARLPIDKHIEMVTRKVLTVNHETKDWKKTFMKAIPKRKVAD